MQPENPSQNAPSEFDLTGAPTWLFVLHPFDRCLLSERWARLVMA